MSRAFLTHFILIALVIFGLDAQLLAQGPKDEGARTEAKSKDLRKVFDAETRRLSDAQSTFDRGKDDKQNAKAQPKKGWTNGEKILLAGFIVGVAVLVVILVEYGKDCRRTSTPGCNLGTDENCFCEEYEPSR